MAKFGRECMDLMLQNYPPICLVAQGLGSGGAKQAYRVTEMLPIILVNKPPRRKKN